MSVEGLKVLLEKKEVVPTFTARDLVERAHQVDSDYLYHVRTYVPVNRAGQAQEGRVSVEEFERRLIQQVKEGRVPRGYITAGYGYGKTTTALYLWDRAQKANLVVVPPFTLTDLMDFLHATYGWLRYKLQDRASASIASLDELYHRYIDISLDRLATSHGLTDEQARSLLAEGRLILELRPNDYLHFFEEATRIALEAGYDGLVILPDEIQQYLRPKSKEGGDPIAPFFGIIQALNTRAAGAGLPFGFVMVITLEELGIIRDNFRRNDLLQRMKDLQIDLTSLYDEEFASNLWHLMAKHFQFEDEKDRVVAPETLQALGEISARSDLSDGPRTIINVFARMVQRHLENPHWPPYTPIDLMTDFLDEQVIRFAGDDKLRRVLRRALESPIVRENPTRYADAVKLAAAFPTKGVPLSVQKRYQLDQPLAELMRRAIGDLVQAGLLEEAAVRLSGLAQVKEQTSWLPSVIREFRLSFNERAKIAQERFEEAFIKMLLAKAFPESRWKVESKRERNYVANRSLVLRGTFDSIRVKYPSRRVQVRLLWENEPVKDTAIDGDICIEYQFTLPDVDHRQSPGTLAESADHTARYQLNLYYHQLRLIPQNMQQQLQDVWSPYELSPIVLGNMYTLIEEKRAEGLIPKADDPVIRRGFQAALLDTMYKLLFNDEVDNYQTHEEVVGALLEARYPNYKPLIVVDNWKSSLDKYINALGSLELAAQRIGEAEVEATKEEIAKLFVLSNTGLDSFMRSFNKQLIEQVKEYPRGGGAGSVRFLLHPMEKTIMDWLRSSSHTSQKQKGQRTYTVHQLNLAKAWRDAANLGYLKEEFDALLKLLEARGLAEAEEDWLVEIASETFDLSELRQQFRQLESDLKTLHDAFADSPQLKELFNRLDEKLRPALKKLNEQSPPDDKLMAQFSMALRELRKRIDTWAEERRTNLLDSLKGLRVPLLPQGHMRDLQQPLQEKVEYVDQVNVLRVALLKEADKCQEQLQARQREINDIEERLQQLTVDYKTLAEQANIIRDLKHAQHGLEKERERVEALYQAYNQWQSLVREGQRLLDSLETKTGSEYDELRAQFNSLSIQIRGEISSQQRKLDAMGLYSSYKERLNKIQQAASGLRAQQRETFNHFQDSLKKVLHSHQLTSTPWQDVRFDENDEAKSYAEVVRNARKILSSQQNLQSQKLEEARQRLNHLHHRLVDLTAEQRRVIQAEAERLLAESESIRGKLVESYHQVLAALETYDVSGIRIAVEHWDSIRAAVRQWLLNAQRVDDQLQKVELTPAEKSLLANIRNLSDADLVTLLGAFGEDAETFWQNLRGLYEKAHVRITVQLLDHDKAVVTDE